MTTGNHREPAAESTPDRDHESAPNPDTIDASGKPVTCTASAEYCRCVKPAGHELTGDELHECDPAECSGAWTGQYGTASWKPVRLPGPVQ